MLAGGGVMSSWVIVNRATGAPVLETWSRAIVAAINTAKHKAVPIEEYLIGVNAAIRNLTPPAGEAAGEKCIIGPSRAASR